MKKNKVLFLLLLLLSGTGCSAQLFKLIKATRQHWSGGVAGRSGIYYAISIETGLKNAVPDTVWINNIAYPLDFSGKNNAYKRTFDSVAHKITYSISAEEVHNELNMRPYPIKKDTVKKAQAPIVKPVRQFKGAALISYRHKHKQRFFTVNSFTDLKPLNYP
jgi:hypothetical protein